MTGDAELVTGDPRWHNFLPGISPLGLFFTGVEASGALSRDVVYNVRTVMFDSWLNSYLFIPPQFELCSPGDSIRAFSPFHFLMFFYQFVIHHFGYFVMPNWQVHACREVTAAVENVEY